MDTNIPISLHDKWQQDDWLSSVKPIAALFADDDPNNAIDHLYYEHVFLQEMRRLKTNFAIPDFITLEHFNDYVGYIHQLFPEVFHPLIIKTALELLRTDFGQKVKFQIFKGYREPEQPEQPRRIQLLLNEYKSKAGIEKKWTREQLLNKEEGFGGRWYLTSLDLGKKGGFATEEELKIVVELLEAHPEAQKWAMKDLKISQQ